MLSCCQEVLTVGGVVVGFFSWSCRCQDFLNVVRIFRYIQLGAHSGNVMSGYLYGSCQMVRIYSFFSKLLKFLIAGVLISECSDFDWSCWQQFPIPNCYQHFLIVVTFLAAGVNVRSIWLL